MSGGASGGDYGAMAATGGSEESKTEGLLASDDVHVAGERKVVMYGFPGSQVRRLAIPWMRRHAAGRAIAWRCGVASHVTPFPFSFSSS